MPFTRRGASTSAPPAEPSSTDGAPTAPSSITPAGEETLAAVEELQEALRREELAYEAELREKLDDVRRKRTEIGTVAGPAVREAVAELINEVAIAPPSGAGMKPNPPDPYKGENLRSCHDFVYQCEGVFRWETKAFPNDGRKVDYAEMYLRGKAQEAWRRHTMEPTPERHSWELFTKWLADEIQDPANRTADYLVRWQEARMSATQSVDSFVNYLDSLIAEVGALKEMSEELKAKTLFAKLRPALRQKLLEHAVNINDKRTLVVEASRFDQLYRDRRAYLATKDPEAQDKGPLRKKWSNPNYEKVTTPYRRLDRDDTQARKTKGACHICQDPGHWANKCPQRQEETTGKDKA